MKWLVKPSMKAANDWLEWTCLLDCPLCLIFVPKKKT